MNTFEAHPAPSPSDPSTNAMDFSSTTLETADSGISLTSSSSEMSWSCLSLQKSSNPSVEERNEQILSEVKQLFITASQAIISSDCKPNIDSLDENTVDLNSCSIGEDQFTAIASACGQSIFMRGALWRYFTDEWILSGDGKDARVRHVKHKKLAWNRFHRLWNDLVKRTNGDADEMLFHILLGTHPQLKSLSGESLEPVLKDVVNNHFELQFLRGNTQFEGKYIETVITRIFFSGSRSPPPLDIDILNGHVRGMNFRELKQVKLRKVLEQLPSTPINEERLFFSYKHFFVIYCKYCDLDGNNQNRIESNQLQKYDMGALNPMICDRVVNGCGLNHPWRVQSNGLFKLRSYFFNANSIRPSIADSGVDLLCDAIMSSTKSEESFATRIVGTLNYPDFMWFIMAEEDRSTTCALEYWFRILDSDSDGVISLYELELFWKKQEDIAYQEGNSSFEFFDVICATLDLTKPYDEDSANVILQQRKTSDEINRQQSPSAITINDMKRHPLSSARFLDFFINWRKLIERESTNGNRLFREIDEKQQIFFQQLHLMPSLGLSNVNENDKSPFNLSKIPCDNRTPWARWADMEYDHYILQEELEKQRRQILSAKITRISKQKKSKWIVASDDNEEDDELLDEEAFDWYCASKEIEDNLQASRKAIKPRKSKKWVKRRNGKSLSASFKIKSSSSSQSSKTKNKTSPEDDTEEVDGVAVVKINVSSDDSNMEEDEGTADCDDDNDDDEEQEVVSDEDDDDEQQSDASTSSSSEDDNELETNVTDKHPISYKSALFGDSDCFENSWADMDPMETNVPDPQFLFQSGNSEPLVSANSPVGTASKEHPRLYMQLSPPRTRMIFNMDVSPNPSPRSSPNKLRIENLSVDMGEVVINDADAISIKQSEEEERQVD